MNTQDSKISKSDQEILNKGISSEKKDIMDAVKHNITNLSSLQDFLSKNRDLVDGNNALHLASYEGNLEFIKFLINKKKVNVNSLNNNSNSALNIAQNEKQNAKSPGEKQKYQAIIDFLLKQGASKIQENKDGHSYLSYVQSNDSDNEANQLIKKSSSDELRHAVGPYGDPASHRAFRKNNHHQFHHFILPKTKDQLTGLNDTNNNGQNIGHLASYHPDDQKFLDSFVNAGGELNDPDYEGNLPIHNATKNRNKKAIDAILKGQKGNTQHAENVKRMLNTPNRNNDTPFTQAIDQSNHPLIDQYVKSGANVDKVGSDGLTPLSKAVNQNNLKLVEKLLKQGANPNVRSGPHNRDSLDIALLHSNKLSSNKDKQINQEIIVQLIGHLNPDNVNDQDDEGNTKLHTLANISNATHSDHKLNKGLINHIVHDHNADLDIVNKREKKPFEISKNKDIKNLLIPKPLVEEQKLKTKRVGRILKETCPPGQKHKCVK